jgi:hypothetical protein
VRRTANDFKRQFDEALREAEREAGLDDARKSIQSIGNPISDLKKDLTGTVSAGTAPPSVAKPSVAPAVAAAAPHEAVPLKGATAQPSAGATRHEPRRYRGSKAPLIEHLIELRSRLIRAIIAIFAAFIICFYFADEIFNILIVPYERPPGRCARSS